MIRALHILDSLNRGGAEMLTLDVCRNAHTEGLELTFVATGTGDLAQEFAALDIDQIWLRRRLPIDPIIVKKLREVVLSRSIKVVHAQQAVEAIHLYLATRGTPAKCVMSLQNYILDTKNRIATKLILPKMDAVCPVSESMQEWFKSDEGFVPDERFHVLHNGVDLARLKPTRQHGAASLRAELGIASSDTLLGMIGNFYPDARKDQLTVCKALPTVMRDVADCHFVFVGSVHDRAHEYFNRCVDHCRDAGIADRVHFVGKRTDIPDLLRELDLFVFSSVQEGLPVAAVEALMLGVPMIVSDIPPLLEVAGCRTQEESVAETFRTGDFENLAARLIDLLRNRERLRELGRRARILTPRRFGIDIHLKNLRKLYEELTDQ